MFRRPTMAGAFAFLCTVLGAFSAPVTAQSGVDGTVSVATVGEPGVRITAGQPVVVSTEEIMRQQAAAPPHGVRPKAKLQKPDRSNLQPNPEAPAVSRFPVGGPSQPDHAEIHTPALSFDGATLADTGAFPPDSMGTVGPTQYMVFVNGRMRSFTKEGVADGVINVDPDVFFAPVMTPVGGGVVLNFTSDPQVRYDRFSNRWFMSIIDVPCANGTCTTLAANRWLLAVSDAASNGTITASTNWTLFQFQTHATNFCDYPSLGIDVNALYVGCNMFSPAGSFVGTNGYVIQKASVLGAGPMVVTSFANIGTGSGGPFAPRGVDNYDPDATEGYFVGVDTAVFSRIVFRRINNPGSATPTISGNLNVTVPTTGATNPVEHLGNTGGNSGRLDSLDDRLYAAMIRDGHLWTAHNLRVNASGVANTGSTARKASRWYDFINLSTTPTLNQSGTVFDNAATLAASLQYWIPSITATGQGHAVLGFSLAGNPAGATPAFVGRLAGDPLGTMTGPPNASAVQIGVTAASYNPPSDPGGGSGRRWGDYSFTVVDPLDDMTVWTIQEFNQATNSYAVRVGKLAAPPPATPTCSTTPIEFPAGTGDVVITATSSNGSGFYDPGADLPAPALPFHHLDATVSGATVNSISYDSPTQITLNITAATTGVRDVTITNPDGQSVTALGCIDVVPGVVTHTVTPSVGSPSGTIAPSTPQTVNEGDTVSFTLTPDAGFEITNVSGSCGGSLIGNVFTTDPVLADCSVVANFAPIVVTHIVTPSVSGGNGTITPSTPQTVIDGDTTSFTLTPDSGFHIDTVTGTCGGSLAGNVFTTDPVIADCTVIASFAAGAPPVCSTGDPIEVSATAGTPGPSGYTTLKGAFDAINDGTHQGAIKVDVCGDTTETASAALNASGTGASSYTNVTVNPAGGAPRTVSGAIAAGSPLIDLAGADNVIIDGLNTDGNALTLANTTASATAGTSTIRFINGATNNAVVHTTVLGSSNATAATAGGNILFSTSTVAGGNSNNVIANNRIGPAGTNLMTKGVMGLGTAANPNVGNTIADNDIFDFFSPTVSSAGISIQGNNNNWTIAANRIYQTAPRTFTATAQRYSGILVAAGGGTFSVTGNRIGFGASDGTGTTTISGSTNEFRGIAFTNAGTTPGNYSLIAGNTISGIEVTSNRNSTTTDLSPFIAIQSGSSATDAPANILGNTIGSLDGSSTIVINAGSITANTSPVQGILDFNFVNDVSVSGNNIGSITINNNAGTGSVVGFRGILVGSTTGVTHTVSGNTIGGTATGSITDNIVGTVSMYGIQVSAANVVATNNIVRNMVGNSTTANGVVLSGILSTGSTGANTISQNTIHSLSNSSGSASNSIYALYCSFGSNPANLVERNLVHSLSINSTATTSQLVGILPIAGSGTYKNNMVRLGYDAAGNSITSGYTIFGMFEVAGSNNIYNNSLFVGGTGVAAASNTFGLVSNVTSGTRNYVDNIIWNARSNASGAGKNYAIGLSAITGATTDYNDLFASGTGGVTGSLASVDAATLADWQAASGQDAQSFAADPLFAAATGTAATVDLHLLPGSPAAGAGTPIAAVTDDFDGDTRPLTNPAVGADEPPAVPTHIVTPSVGTPSGTISPSTPQTVADGATTSFTLTPDAGFAIDNVGGTCGGSLVGNVFTTDPVTGDCTVIANFVAVVVTHTVTPSVGTPSGTISPSTPQVVADGATVAFTLTPDAGFDIDDVGGTCGGSLVGNIFTTDPVTADCTVIANFTANPIADVSPGNLSFNVGAGGTASSPLHIANIGGGTLTWAITEAPASLPGTPVGTAASVAMRPAVVSTGSETLVMSDRPVARGHAIEIVEDTQISQMTDNTPVSPNGISCGTTGVNTADNSWWRRFYFNEHPAVGSSASITAVTVAVESGPNVPATINLYTIPHSVTVDTIPAAQLTLIGSTTTTIGGTLTSVTIPVTGTVADTANQDLVVEYHIDGAPTPFFPGGNATPQTHKTFISSATCGINNPTDIASIGFPDFHVIMIVNVAEPAAVGCDNPADVPWLSATPDSGSVAGGSAQDSTIAVDATGLAAGSYSAHLCVETNDPTHALVDVPVSLTVAAPPAPPTLAKAFAPTSVTVNTPSTLTLTLGNTNASAATLTSALTDTFPSGLVVANPANASTTCPSGSVTATAGSGSVSLSSGAQIPANGTCTVSVSVTSAAAGSYVNTVAAGALQTDMGSNANPATATLTVTPALAAPTLAKAFAPGSVTVDTPSTLTLTLANTNASAATLTAALTDTFPSGLVVANPASASTTCPSGSVTANPGAGSISLSSGAQIPANGSCTVTVHVTSATAGSYVNTIPAGALQTNAGSNAAAATATLTVTPVVIDDRIFCDGFEGTACAPAGIGFDVVSNDWTTSLFADVGAGDRRTIN